MRKLCKMIGTLAVLVSVALSTLAGQPASEVRGTVTDGDSGRPLAGVSVKLSGSAVSTTTDAKGAYAIRVPPRPCSNSPAKATRPGKSPPKDGRRSMSR